MNPSTASTSGCATTCPPSTSGCTARGWLMRSNSRKACLHSTSERIILIPPPVEPDEDAIEQSSSSSKPANIGHCAAPTLEKPVVVPIETVLKTACRIACGHCSKTPVR